MFEVKSTTTDPDTGSYIVLGNFSTVEEARQTIQNYFNEKAQAGTPSTFIFQILSQVVVDTLYPFSK